MTMKYTDEEFHQMEINEFFEQDEESNMFAVSRVFAAARKQMNLAEYKAFSLALSSVRWKEECPELICIDKKKAAEIIGVNSDSDHLSQDLKRSIGHLPQHSFLEFDKKDRGEWINGNFIISVGYYKKRLRIRMNPDYLALFGKLDGQERKYITLWSNDIYKMRSERAVLFYELLRENSDTRKDINTGTIGIKKFKELFNIPKDGKGSYMRTEKNGGFNRQAFEQYVIDPVCDDLSHTDMIRLILQPTGKFYEKVKRGNRIIAYKFYWEITMHPGVANAQEVSAIQEHVDKDPQVLKVAKDILKGDKSPKKSKKNGFTEYTGSRDYDYDAIEAQLLEIDSVKS